MKKVHKRRSLLAVLITFAISSLGATIVFPIFAPLFLSPNHQMVTDLIPDSMRAIMLGLFLASFPFAQFIFSPIIGEYADKKGRKKAFLWTIFFEVIGYCITAMAISWHHLSLLFVGRFLTGLAAGNMSVCLATLVDLSENEKTKVRYFGYGSAVIGVMYVLGPFLGGRLSDSSISSFFSFAFPMWVGAFLALINLILLALIFKETLHKEEEEKFDLMKAVHNVQFAFQEKKIRDLYLIYFYFLFAWNMLFQFIPAHMVDVFKASSTFIGDLSAYLGIIWIVATIFVTQIMHRKASMKPLSIAALILFGLLCLLIPFSEGKRSFYVVTTLVVFCAGGMWPILTGAISNTVHVKNQGKILGVGQSVQSLSMVTAPLLGGVFLQAYEKVPFVVASLAAFLGALHLYRARLSQF